MRRLARRIAFGAERLVAFRELLRDRAGTAPFRSDSGWRTGRPSIIAHRNEAGEGAGDEGLVGTIDIIERELLLEGGNAESRHSAACCRG